MPEPTDRRPHFPGLAPIDSYGNGGFRFAGMSHRGSILCLPSGIYGWEAPAPAQLGLDSLAAVLAERSGLDVLLLGTGGVQHFPPASVRQAFAEAGLALEPMATGAAARTFNVLLGEGRRVAAALIAVD